MKPVEQTTALPIDLSQLTPEQKKALFAEVAQQQKDEETRLRKERETYKDIVNSEVNRLFPLLKEVSDKLADAKHKVVNSLKELVITKAVLYNREDDQNKHSFTNADGSITIEIGFNILDGWDDTVNIGISKINDYLKGLAKDAETGMLVDAITKLLTKDKNGNLKASRVLQLKQMAEKSQDAGFIDAIKIIEEAYKPARTKEFVRCTIKNAKGEKTILPLSITDADLSDTK